jgi:hypothetical protein
LHEDETVDGLLCDAVFGAQEALLLYAERDDDGLALKLRSASSDGLSEDLDEGWEGLQCEELLDLVDQSRVACLALSFYLYTLALHFWSLTLASS